MWLCFRSMSSRFSNFSTGNDNNALLSTGEFLRFTGEDQTANFVPGVATVRSAALPGQCKGVGLATSDHLCRSLLACGGRSGSHAGPCNAQATCCAQTTC